ncbi:class I SAM-dependent methyltransferase [Arthrobacter rhombi]|uniref:class I SAM-dependent methyltransferase n=1 Tax=Arthrobacter rhombi TaxID=71253 RepID=UPI003F8DD460
MVQKSRRLSGRRQAGRPLGNPTRGTTSPNRMRRVDRWMTGTQNFRLRPDVTGAPPICVDLGYGASPRTAVEYFQRLRAVNPRVAVVGLEIDPGRVLAAKLLEVEGLSFTVGGFEIPTERNPLLIRAFNVLRQYNEEDVAAIWSSLAARLDPAGLLIEGTCDEIGRVSTWVGVSPEGPLTLSISIRFGAVQRPSEVAERLPKALIHRNHPGERVHDFLAAADAAWLAAAPLATFGQRQRWMAMCRALRAEGWPVRDGPSRWRLGELTVDWACVAPRTGSLAL